MTLEELKNSILDNTLSDEFIILKCEDNFFIADQYVDMICKNKCMSKEIVDSIFSNTDTSLSLIFNYDSVLSVVKVDEFNEDDDNYSRFTNTIVICKSIDKKIADKVKEFVVEIPKLVDWQLEDYVRVYCAGLDDKEVSFLVNSCNKNIYKLENEVNRLGIFDKNEQKEILNEAKFSQDTGYVTFSPFDLCGAIVSKDLMKVGTCLYYRKFCDFDPVHLVSILLNQFKNMLYLGFNSGVTAEQLKISSGRAYYIKQDARKYTQEQIKNVISKLTYFDQQLKSGLMDTSKDRQADYLITNILGAIL